MCYTKWLAAALCIVLLVALAVFFIKPNKVNEVNKGGFGPKIKGYQLGQKMSPMDIVSWVVDKEELPFTLKLNWEDGNDLFIKFEGQGKDIKSFRVDTAEGRYAKLKNFSGKLEDLMSKIEKLGFNGAARMFWGVNVDENIRINRLWFSKSDFDADSMTPKEFAQALIDAYDIPGLEGIGINKWQHRNLEQGWQVTVSEWGVAVEPIIVNAVFD